MKPSGLLTRRFSVQPFRHSHARPQLLQSQPTTTRFARWNSTSNPAGNNGSSSALGTSGKVLIASVLAGGIGYTYAASSQSTSSASAPSVAAVSGSQGSTKAQYGSVEDFQKAIAELRARLGSDTISTDEEELERHGFSEWSTVNSDRFPVAIAYPHTTEEVSEIAKVCQKYRMPMIPYSGGSSLEGNFSTPRGGMTIDFVNMNRIIQVHAEDMDVVVQPAVRWMDLNVALKEHGLFFPMDPGPPAMIGGMVGTNCSGTNAVRYGTMKDWVINLTVVLADGRIIKTRRRPRKTSAGYNLTGMFVGSEGTLGIVTEVTLKLAPIPEETRVAVCSFPTIRDAAAAARTVIQNGVQIQCIEILDDVQMYALNRAGGTGRTWDELPTLFFKFSGTSASVADSVTLTETITKTNNSKSFTFAQDEKEAHELWSARKEALWSMMAVREDGGSDVYSTDTVVPLSRLPEIIEMSKKDLQDLGLFASILGHIGDGNFHASVMYDKKKPGEYEKLEKVVHDMVKRALEMDGSCTGEHAVGMGKKGFLLEELGEETISVMRSIKRSLDPNWLMNPGKIFDEE